MSIAPRYYILCKKSAPNRIFDSSVQPINPKYYVKDNENCWKDSTTQKRQYLLWHKSKCFLNSLVLIVGYTVARKFTGTTVSIIDFHDMYFTRAVRSAVLINIFYDNVGDYYER